MVRSCFSLVWQGADAEGSSPYCCCWDMLYGSGGDSDGDDSDSDIADDF